LLSIFFGLIFLLSVSWSGFGALRAAINAKVLRTIMFEERGSIKRGSHLSINSPLVTLVGPTPLSPGISLRGVGMSITTNDVFDTASA
jgi:hypothetical protein